ncbi:MAG: polysaccharide biosynthesis tyrosine autokinase [Verrucomicrobiota bacterium]
MDDEQSAPVHYDRSTAAGRFLNLLNRYKHLLRTRWWVLAVAVLLALGVQGFMLWRGQPSYQSIARMIVNVRLSLPSANAYSEELNNFYGTQVTLMQSDSVANRVRLQLQTQKPELQPAPVKLQVSISPKTSIFNLLATGDEPLYTQAYLEATMEEYINLKKELGGNASDATKAGLQEELAQMALELEKSKQAMLNYESSNSVVLFRQNGGNSAAEFLFDLTRQMADLKSELQLLQSLTLDENLERQQTLLAKSSLAGASLPRASAPPQAAAGDNSAAQPDSAAPNGDTSPGPTPSTLGGFEAAYLQAKQQILMLKAERDELSTYLRPKHPKIIDMNDQIARQENLLKIYGEQSMERLNNRRHTLEVQLQNLQQQIGQWEAKSVDASRKLSDYQTIKEKNARLQSMYDQLLTTLHTLDVSKGVGQESVTVLMPATPAAQVLPEPLKQYGQAGLIGLMGGIGLLLLLNRIDDRPGSLSDLQQLFDEPVLGQVPFIKTGKDESLLTLDQNDGRHILVEAFRSLRSSIVCMDLDAAQNHPKTIVVTSSIPGEGKSMTSANLAIAFAQTGARVLLVDADLRRGVLHGHFSKPVRPGIAEVLTGATPWQSAAAETAVPNLKLIPSGVLPRSRSGDTFAKQIEKFLAESAAQFDYVLFDTAPVMAADDVSNLAPHVDGVIMVVRSRFTSGRVAQAAMDFLHLRHVKVMGLVSSAVDAGVSEYYYYNFKDYHAHPANA